MTPADQYRHLAAELHARASNERRADLEAEWSYLAHCYEVLASHADKNDRTDVGQEPILNGGLHLNFYARNQTNLSALVASANLGR